MPGGAIYGDSPPGGAAAIAKKSALNVQYRLWNGPFLAPRRPASSQKTGFLGKPRGGLAAEMKNRAAISILMDIDHLFGSLS